ncbi:proton-coupled amino acid transporter-like protein CG1139 [Ochlerotatus camptorhynchus]|uniref:proton-coupled amino acid transporter-like protein CG1139 n=1 Tax=Ochlerotatus camptorhynchus TaxID=644619 RepID=UPI0031CFEE39
MSSSVESLERTYQDDYEPFEHRKIEKPNTTIGSFIHIIKGSLGTGIMAMPLAFKNGGLLMGSIGTVVICVLYTHFIHLLVSTSQKASKRSQVPMLGFSETARDVFSKGPTCVRPYKNYASGFIDWMMVIDSFLTACLYIVFISKSLRDVLHNQLQIDWDTRVYILLLLVPLLIIIQVRKLKHLVPFTAVAITLIITSVGISLYFVFSEPIVLSDKELWPKWTTIPTFISTVLFAISGINTVLPVENNMKHPKHFLRTFGVMQCAFGFLTVFYGITGFFGYAKYGEATMGSITLNLPSDNGWAETTRLISAMGIFVALGFSLYVPLEIVWPQVESRVPLKWHNWGQITMRSVLAVAMIAAAFIVPEIEPFIGLLGSFSVAALSILFPVAMDLIFRWPNDFGVFKWHLIKDILLCVFGLFVLIVGTHFSILDIIDIYQ